ncbi:hypothetical protein HDK90DRAFT_529469 [Phyllosticta capitalensis]|uniref:Uncharacterized protein n=1 Tax=Phyllosticta capitalensis TaxID=121624 RepID=A0ABR1Y8J8_9PEZI
MSKDRQDDVMPLTNEQEKAECPKTSACEKVLRVAELRELIALAVIDTSSTAAEVSTDLLNLRLSQKAWNTIIKESPSIKRETFAIPLQQRRLPATTSGDRETQWRELVPLADLYDWNAPRYIQASDLDFNPILSNLTLRFKTNVATPTATQVNDTVKVKLGNDAWAQSFYVSYLNQESEPCVDGGVEVDLWKGFGKSTCDQFICQPPVSRMRITFFSDTETFIWGVRKAGGEIVVESGVQMWHVLATLLDALAVDGGKEIHDLYGEAADLVTERV